MAPSKVGDRAGMSAAGVHAVVGAAASIEDDDPGKSSGFFEAARATLLQPTSTGPVRAEGVESRELLGHRPVTPTDDGGEHVEDAAPCRLAAASEQDRSSVVDRRVLGYPDQPCRAIGELAIVAGHQHDSFHEALVRPAADAVQHLKRGQRHPFHVALPRRRFRLQSAHRLKLSRHVRHDPFTRDQHRLGQLRDVATYRPADAGG
jgi:hypothetical protein